MVPNNETTPIPEAPPIEFNIGDTIFYPAQGAGVVEELTTREILGETKEYMRLSFIRGDLDVLVPLDKGEEVGLRHTFKEGDAAELTTLLIESSVELPEQWPPRHRFELEVIARAESKELAGLIATLTRRDLERGLADTERDIMEKAKEMLATEFAAVQSITLDTAKAHIKKTLEAHES